jgi:hypothetical protein
MANPANDPKAALLADDLKEFALYAFPLPYKPELLLMMSQDAACLGLPQELHLHNLQRARIRLMEASLLQQGSVRNMYAVSNQLFLINALS